MLFAKCSAKLPKAARCPTPLTLLHDIFFLCKTDSYQINDNKLLVISPLVQLQEVARNARSSTTECPTADTTASFGNYNTAILLHPMMSRRDCGGGGGGGEEGAPRLQQKHSDWDFFKKSASELVACPGCPWMSLQQSCAESTCSE